jgi:hypothetical protein
MIQRLFLLTTLLISTSQVWGEDYLPHFSVNSQEVSAVICRRDFLDNSRELEKSIQALVGPENSINKTILGIDLKLENPHLVEAFKKLFTRRGHNHPLDFVQSQVDLRHDLQVEGCHSVMCAVKKVWGPERGLKVLWIMLRYGFNASEYAYDDSETPDTHELNDIISALDLLPEKSKEIILGKNIPFLAYKDITGKQPAPGPNVLANSSIYFFPILRVSSSESRIQAFHHELGHLFLNNSDLKKDWLKVSGWDWNGDRSGRCGVSRYGTESSGEDFAETFNMFRMAPERLNFLCPHKYQFMKNHVFMLEYDQTKACNFQDQLNISMKTQAQNSTPTSSGISTFNLKRLENLQNKIGNAVKAHSRNIKEVNVNFRDGADDENLMERREGISFKLKLTLKTPGGVSLPYSCLLNFKILGTEAWLKQCTPLDHFLPIKGYVPIKKDQLLLKLN